MPYTITAFVVSEYGDGDCLLEMGGDDPEHVLGYVASEIDYATLDENDHIEVHIHRHESEDD